MGIFKNLFSGNKASGQAKRLDSGAFRVEVFDSYYDADMSVKFSSLFGKGSPSLRLSVLPARLASGVLEWYGEDADKKRYDLATLKEPAVLVIGRETLPLLQQSALWGRVKGVSQVTSGGGR